ncbi:hypothetical protein AVXHC19_17090 [Acidovorax sacchari]
MVNWRRRPAVLTAPILLPLEITKQQVPLGTQVLAIKQLPNTRASSACEVKCHKLTYDEYERAHDAYGQFKAQGSSTLTCLRCGTGHFQFVENNNSVEIRCYTPNCLVERIRGI